MRSIENKFITLALLSVCAAFLLNACGGIKSAATDSPSIPPAAPIASDNARDDGAIRFLENKLKTDPEDFSANNKLAGLYLQKLRETGNVQYLDLTFRIAGASRRSVPEVRNAGGLVALALCEHAAHDFTMARDHAVRLIEIEPTKSYPQGILGDALLELGEYDKAEIAFKKITLLEGGASSDSETRFARLAQLKGDNAAAQKHFAAALNLALSQSAPPRETIAWLRWQLGETAFSVGDYETAEKHYRDSLTTFPDYYRSIASLGRVRAARNDLPGAIENYEKVTRILPDPSYIAALGDLYKLAGREEDAKNQYELVEKIGHLSELNGALYNRQLALFYADRDMKTDAAYQLAAKEYEARRDIYGADALAWTALKAGKIAEAQAAMKDALRLNTEDARHDDSQNVTAAFNLNLLKRINRELGANFDVEKFSHYAEYNPVEGAARSFLISRENQTVFVESLDREFQFDAHEPVFTEVSQKYSLPIIEQIARESGFKVVRNFCDEKSYFADSLWQTV